MVRAASRRAHELRPQDPRSDECEQTGARAAEQIVCGTRTTGAESETEQGTALARRMMTCCGMSERVVLL